MSTNLAYGDGFRPHDLLWLDAPEALICTTEVPAWVAASLERAPVVVVRRTASAFGLAPVGVRGAVRNHRFAAAVAFDRVTRRLSPEQLVAERRPADAARAAAIPALQAFERVLAIQADWTFAWGPTGSVGFELATGIPTATASSDLDLLLRVPDRFGRSQARAMLADLSRIEAMADVQMETPAGCISMKEYCATEAPRPLLVRTADGPILTSDPWGSERGDER